MQHTSDERNLIRANNIPGIKNKFFLKTRNIKSLLYPQINPCEYQYIHGYGNRYKEHGATEICKAARQNTEDLRKLCENNPSTCPKIILDTLQKKLSKMPDPSPENIEDQALKRKEKVKGRKKPKHAPRIIPTKKIMFESKIPDRPFSHTLETSDHLMKEIDAIPSGRRDRVNLDVIYEGEKRRIALQNKELEKEMHRELGFYFKPEKGKYMDLAESEIISEYDNGSMISMGTREKKKAIKEEEKRAKKQQDDLAYEPSSVGFETIYERKKSSSKKSSSKKSSSKKSQNLELPYSSIPSSPIGLSRAFLDAREKKQK